MNIFSIFKRPKHASATDIENAIRTMIEGEETVTNAVVTDAIADAFCEKCWEDFINKHGGCCLSHAVDDFLTQEGWD